MKLKSLLITLIAGLLFVGCTPSSPMLKSPAMIKQNILGSWHTKSQKTGKDGMILLANDVETFYHSGRLTSRETITFTDRTGRIFGKVAYTRYFKYKIVGRNVVTKFIRCKTRTIRRPRNEKVRFVNKFLKMACNYATKDKRNKNYHSAKRINSLSADTLNVAGKSFKRIR